MTEVWQIAAGTSERNYTNLFLKHDIMFMGPGRYEDFNKKESAYKQAVNEGQETRHKIAQIQAFVREVETGDFILLRKGYKVAAIGIAHEEGYKWDPAFDDVFGWDLQHTRRVIWQEHLEGKLKEIQGNKNGAVFSNMKQIPTFSRVHAERFLTPVKSLFSQCKNRKLKELPSPPPAPLSMDQIGQELFSKGLPNEAVDKVIVAIQRQRRLIRWYDRDSKKSGRPTEHEIVTHMILPLMLALGWSEQLLAIEWRSIDLAAFRETPTTPERCVLVCEAKWYGHGLQNVLEQAKGYIEKLKLNDCRKILVTDGARLYLYERNRAGWNDKPAGYLNVNSIRMEHIAPANTNAIDTIIALTPSGISREVKK